MPYLNVVGLNPSTADEVTNDPTITRCINYARAWGYGALYMTNIYAYRSTDPRGLRDAHDPVGPRNDEFLFATARAAGIVVAAWGTWGNRLFRRADAVVDLLRRARRLCDRDRPVLPGYDPGRRSAPSACCAELGGFVTETDLYCLGVTKDGDPRHPLYLSKDVWPVPYVVKEPT